MHGEQSISFSKPLPTSSERKEFELRAKVIGVYDKGKPGSVVETEHLLVEKSSGEVYSRAVGSSFFVGQGNWNGPKGNAGTYIAESHPNVCAGPKTVNYPPPEGEKPHFEYIHPTNAESAHLYR